MSNKQLENYCHELRSAIMTVKEMTILLKSFPLGCCRDVSVILGGYLKDKGFEDITYCHRENDDHFTSHAWLEVGGYILDLTADQFGDAYPPVTVIPDSSLEKIYSNKVTEKWNYGIVSIDFFELMKDYDRIVLAIDQGHRPDAEGLNSKLD